MNQAHLHLALNHFPIICPIIGLLLMLGGYFFRSEVVKRTAYVVFIMGAVLTIPAFYTGEGAEEVVEYMQGVDEKLIHTHEEAAELFAWLSYTLGVIAVAGLWTNYKKHWFSEALGIITILFTVIILYFGMETGTTGGEIMHQEIRDGYTTPTTEEIE